METTKEKLIQQRKSLDNKIKEAENKESQEQLKPLNEMLKRVVGKAYKHFSMEKQTYYLIKRIIPKSKYYTYPLVKLEAQMVIIYSNKDIFFTDSAILESYNFQGDDILKILKRGITLDHYRLILNKVREKIK